MSDRYKQRIWGKYLMWCTNYSYYIYIYYDSYQYYPLTPLYTFALYKSRPQFCRYKMLQSYTKLGLHRFTALFQKTYINSRPLSPQIMWMAVLETCHPTQACLTKTLWLRGMVHIYKRLHNLEPDGENSKDSGLIGEKIHSCNMEDQNNADFTMHYACP